MTSYQQKYVVVVALIIGIIVGMVQQQIVVPVFGGSDKPYYHGRRGYNNIALVFNVDWGQEYIPAILRILEDRDVKVTFFVTGNWAKKFPDILKKIAQRNHEIGNHGYSHQHPKNLSHQELKNLIKRNEELIYQITGKMTTLFSPPYGEVDNRIVATASSLNYKTVMWSADTIDWQRPSPEIIVQRAINKIDDGGIILMHPTSPSVKALPQIINTLEKRGYNFVTVSELIS